MKDMNSNLIEKWAVYEANVQAYRSNMIASQAFLLAVSSILLEKNEWVNLICVALALFQLWYIWIPVVFKRCIIVDYYKFELSKKYDNYGNPSENSDIPLTENTYVKNKTIRNKIHMDLARKEGLNKLKHNIRITRLKLDIILPITFSILWIVFGVYGFLN